MRIRSRTATPSSSEPTETCTWSPHVNCSLAVRPKPSIMAAYRGPRVVCMTVGRGDVAKAATLAPTARAAASAASRPRRISSNRPSRLEQGLVCTSICSRLNSTARTGSPSADEVPAAVLLTASSSPAKGSSRPSAGSTISSSSSTPNVRIPSLWTSDTRFVRTLHGARTALGTTNRKEPRPPRMTRRYYDLIHTPQWQMSDDTRKWQAQNGQARNRSDRDRVPGHRGSGRRHPRLSRGMERSRQHSGRPGGDCALASRGPLRGRSAHLDRIGIRKSTLVSEGHFSTDTDPLSAENYNRTPVARLRCRNLRARSSGRYRLPIPAPRHPPVTTVKLK